MIEMKNIDMASLKIFDPFDKHVTNYLVFSF